MPVPLISLMETDGNFPEMYDVEAARKRVREGEWVEVPSGDFSRAFASPSEVGVSTGLLRSLHPSMNPFVIQLWYPPICGCGSTSSPLASCHLPSLST